MRTNVDGKAAYYREGLEFWTIDGFVWDLNISKNVVYRSTTASMPLSFLDTLRMQFNIREMLRSGRIIKYNRLEHGPLE